ncbi:MAG: MFS transporter [Candidatus Saliniplasma sp.]
MKRGKILALVILPLFLVFLSTSMYMPNIGDIETEFGNNSWIIPLTITTFLFGQAVFQIIYGSLSDKYGRYKVYIPALFGFVISNILCYLSWSGSSLVIFRSLQGATIACGFVVGATVIGDVYPRTTRGKAMGLFLAIPLLGPPVGSFFGGLLGELFGWRSIFIFLAVLGAITTLLFTLYLPETLDKEKTQSKKILLSFSSLKRLDFAAVTLLGLSILGTYFTFHLFFSLILDNIYSFTPFYIGLFLTVYGLVDSSSVYIGGRISVFYSYRNLLLISSFVAGVSALLFALLLGFPPYLLLASFLIFGVGIGLGTTPFVTYIMDLSPESKGSAIGVFNFVRLMGAAFVPFGGHFVITEFSEKTLFLFSAIFIFITVLLAYSFTDIKKK